MAGRHALQADSHRAASTYFSACDAQLDQHIPAKRFKPDLINRLLLEDSLVIPDVFFVISERIASDLISPYSWVLEGLRRGIIRPALRDSEGSFTRSITAIQDQHTIGLVSDVDVIKQRLSGTREFDFVNWPPQVGKHYRAMMSSVFDDQQDVVSQLTEEEKALWTETESLRSFMLENAERASPDLEEHGIRRADLLRALARSANFNGDAADTQAMTGSLPPALQKQYRAVMLWVHEIYHLNQAELFGARPSFPVTRVSGASIIARKQADNLISTPGLPDGTSFIEVVPWPTASRLLDTRPSHVLQVREDQGRAYLNSLHAFRIAPGPATWTSMASDLREYGDALCKTTKDRANAVVSYQSRLEDVGAGALSTAMGVAVGQLGIDLNDPISQNLLSLGTGLVGSFIPMIASTVRDSSRRLQVRSGGHGDLQIDYSSAFRSPI